jgi:hypothetical protein
VRKGFAFPMVTPLHSFEAVPRRGGTASTHLTAPIGKPEAFRTSSGKPHKPAPTLNRSLPGLPSSTVATNDGQRHVICERAGGREILDSTQYGEKRRSGGAGSRTAQLRLESLVAELLTGVVDRLSDAV